MYILHPIPDRSDHFSSWNLQHHGIWSVADHQIELGRLGGVPGIKYVSMEGGVGGLYLILVPKKVSIDLKLLAT